MLAYVFASFIKKNVGFFRGITRRYPFYSKQQGAHCVGQGLGLSLFLATLFLEYLRILSLDSMRFVLEKA